MLLCSRCDNVLIGDGADNCQHCADEVKKRLPGSMNSAYGGRFDELVDKYGVSAEDEEKASLQM